MWTSLRRVGRNMVCVSAFATLGCGQSTYNATGEKLVELPGNNQAAIEAVIFEKYLGGQKYGSVELVQSAFHSDSVMILPIKDEAGKSRLKKWTDMHETVVEWANPGNTELDLTNFEILSIQAVDDRMAVVLLKVESRVYDALTLVKIDGEWKIVSKVYISQ